MKAERTCSRCHESKPLDQFSLDKNTYKRKCKACICELYREKYSDNRMIAKERAANRAFSDLITGWPAPR